MAVTNPILFHIQLSAVVLTRYKCSLAAKGANITSTLRYTLVQSRVNEKNIIRVLQYYTIRY